MYLREIIDCAAGRTMLRETAQSTQDALIALARYLRSRSSVLRMIRFTFRPMLLVHFSLEAKAIATHGFLHGLPTPAAIAVPVTSEIPNSLKPGGYNYAYKADWPETERWVDGELAVDGMDAVLFNAPGMMIEHRDDGERQIIFWGLSVPPADIQLLERQGDLDQWSISGTDVHGSYAECVAKLS